MFVKCTDHVDEYSYNSCLVMGVVLYSLVPRA